MSTKVTESSHPSTEVAQARHALLRFFHATGLHNHFGARTHPVVEDTVLKTIQLWGLQIPDGVWQKYAFCALDIATTAYRATTVDQQISVALFTFLATLFDDALMGLDAMREFVPRFYGGLPQTHPILTRFHQMTLELGTYCPHITANTLVSATMEYANAEVFVREGRDQVASRLQRESSEYIEYVRMKEGIPEVYAVLVWPRDMCPDVTQYVQAIPDALRFINYINDLFSYYKEAMDGDTTNYLSRYSRVHGLSMSHALRDLVDNIMSALGRIRALLPEGTQEREAWEHFAAGYVQFHTQSKRYRLDNVIPEYLNF